MADETIIEIDVKIRREGSDKVSILGQKFSDPKDAVVWIATRGKEWLGKEPTLIEGPVTNDVEDEQ